MSRPTVNTDALRMVSDKIDAWQQMRAELRAIEQAEHPDTTDGHGRVWVWVDGDLYSHDNTLAFPRDMIGLAGLPSPRLANNPNYAGLCDICTAEWPAR